MSVHGEFSRSLESVISCIRAVDRPERAGWLARLESARLARHPDLSSAARDALQAIALLEPAATDSARLAQERNHLAAHCRIILGLESPKDGTAKG